MINDLKEFWRENGFEKVGRRGFYRRSNSVSSLASEISRVGHREVRLLAALEIHDPWVLERDYQVLDLIGDVTSEGIYVYYDHSPCWLHPDESESVHAVVRGCLMNWFEYWSNLLHFIEYLENPVDIVMTRPGDKGERCAHIKGVPAKKRQAPVTNYYLSLLHYHAGDLQKSLASAERYLQFVEREIRLEGEPERTRRQIEAIRSKVRADQK